MFISKVSSSFLFLERYRFILLAKTNISTTRLAQSAERQPFKLVVEGSSPSSGAIYFFVGCVFAVMVVSYGYSICR